MGGSVSMIDGHIDEVLKPCPFCGGNCDIAYNIQRVFGNDNISYIPFCENDDCFMNMNEVGFNTEAEAIEAWNRRADNGKRAD